MQGPCIDCDKPRGLFHKFRIVGWFAESLGALLEMYMDRVLIFVKVRFVVDTWIASWLS
jgi:hypothetical protein